MQITDQSNSKIKVLNLKRMENKISLDEIKEIKKNHKKKINFCKYAIPITYFIMLIIMGVLAIKKVSFFFQIPFCFFTHIILACSLALLNYYYHYENHLEIMIIKKKYPITEIKKLIEEKL